MLRTRWIFAGVLACGPVGPVGTSEGVGSSEGSTAAASAPTTTSGGTTGTPSPSSTSGGTTGGTGGSGTTWCQESTGSGAGEPVDPEEAALALECLGRTDAASCQAPLPAGSDAYCLWLGGRRFPSCAEGCAGSVATELCVAMRSYPETGCTCACDQYWHDGPDGLLVVPDAEDAGFGFCFEFPLGWLGCSDAVAACGCCNEPCI